MIIDLKKETSLEGYSPTNEEEFMNPTMKEYFRKKLLMWRDELSGEYARAVVRLQEHSSKESDPNDRASLEVERNFIIRTMDREQKLINKIDEALDKIEQGAYGYCDHTGEPIDVARLEARPVATLSIDAQEKLERIEKIYRE